MLADLNVDQNQCDNEGRTPLFVAAHEGVADVVKLLLANDRVDANRFPCEGGMPGCGPLAAAGYQGHPGCVELLLANERVDICTGSRIEPFFAVCLGVMEKIGTIGATVRRDNPTDCLVLMLKSRRIPPRHVVESITLLRRKMPTQRRQR